MIQVVKLRAVLSNAAFGLCCEAVCTLTKYIPIFFFYIRSSNEVVGFDKSVCRSQNLDFTGSFVSQEARFPDIFVLEHLQSALTYVKGTDVAVLPLRKDINGLDSCR